MGASNRQHIHTPNTWGKLIMDGQAGMDKVTLNCRRTFLFYVMACHK